MGTKQRIGWRVCGVAGACLILIGGGAGAASAALISGTGVVTQFQLTTPSGAFPPQTNQPMPFSFSQQDTTFGVIGFATLNFVFVPGTNLFGIVTPQGLGLEMTTATAFTDTLFVQFSVTYQADANGVINVPSNFGATIAATTGTTNSFATLSAQLNYTLVGVGTFGTQTLSYDTRVFGPTPGTFITAPQGPVTVNVGANQFLNLSGFFQFQVFGNAALGVQPSGGLGEPGPEAVPEPASLTLLAGGALGLLVYGWHRRRRGA